MKKNIMALVLFSLPMLVQAQSKEDAAYHQVIRVTTTNQTQPEQSNNFKAARGQQNAVFITQIGNKNTVDSHVKSATDTSTYYQYGNQNTILATVNALEVQQDIRQLGDDNRFEKYSFDATMANQIQVIQEGNNQEINVFGSNSMSKDMKIHVQGNDKTIIVRNYQ
ncbi:hypothetical protein [Flavobacterium sp. JP2137]|uniref:hypothetical protein n=1 Tax=Flavobacterium sp. JP2137 TaxID=3414510 RepID=UPI003D2FF2A5